MFDKINHEFKNSKLAIFQEMQNCVETTGFVFKNVVLLCHIQKSNPGKAV